MTSCTLLCLSPVLGLIAARLLTREGLPWLPGDCEEIVLGRDLAAHRRAAEEAREEAREEAAASRRSSSRSSVSAAEGGKGGHAVCDA